ncbi:unnamed protein product [Cylindrotheca closterium]|uniref:sn-1-specific diacylglycerol lipase n=1 Tax=Cylindrotheca closterium TaxID=2856 RepID=A0AAD2G6W2_9STRA|nr:unnamed protein product [Cylindrotheca closterium]
MRAISLLRSRMTALANQIRPTIAGGIERMAVVLQWEKIEEYQDSMEQFFLMDKLSLRRDDLVDQVNSNLANVRGHMVLTAHKRARLIEKALLRPEKRYFSFTPYDKGKNFKWLRQGLSAFLSIGGFIVSSGRSWYANYQSKALFTAIESFELFMKKSGLEKEVSQTVNSHLAVDLKLLSSIQSELWKNRYLPNQPQPPSLRRNGGKQSWIEAKRYMSYATAAYGQAMIHAANVEARGNFEFEHVGKIPAAAVAKHICLKEEDIHLLDVDYNGDAKHLRHFVAIDHENKKVVLSIRGTFSPQEIVVDICAFTTDFCGGEAHSEMASMSERVWENAGPIIVKLLDEHPGYEFIVTGHSLGAGTACLLTVLVQSKKLVSAPTRCFAYASPPVFRPIDAVPDINSITNFVHNNDMVPFLSIFSVRNLLSQLRSIQSFAYSTMSYQSRFRMLMGWEKLTPAIMKHHNEWKPFEVALTGAPELQVPAARTIWLQEKREGFYDWECFTPEEMLQNYSYVRVHPEMLTDHFAPSYEFAFEHLWLEDVED